MEIIYQDESLLVINKPGNLLTIRDGYQSDLPTVKSIIESQYGRCWIVHRLDKGTSGALIIARDESSHRLLNLSFQNHIVKKTYHALVIGNPLFREQLIDQPLKINGDRGHRTIIDPVEGKSARSLIKVLERFKKNALVSIEPESGYTHQIRAHLAFSGYPILGDSLYQRKSDFINPSNTLLPRPALHAYQIQFPHPILKTWMSFIAEYPDDFKNAINSLK
jgi:tRNA pseudouridine32 synthase / 23S rRNA pseudouridine746 synthase